MNRRALLTGLALLPTAASAQSALGTSSPPTPTQAAPPENPQKPYGGDTVSPLYRRAVITRWGDAVLPEAPPFDPFLLSPEQAAEQFPYDAILAGLITPPPAQDGIPRLVAVLANPYPNPAMLYPSGQDNAQISGKLQGATILNLQYQNGAWLFAAGGYQNRRLTDGTLCQLTGPAAGLLGGTVQGLLGPSAATTTPWNTALLAEGDPNILLSLLANTEYGFSNPANGAKFGWIAELNPLDPGAFPIKRTSLGRFPRAGLLATQTADGRPVIFMSHDAPAGFLFRFIAATSATDGTALDTGTLSAAQIKDQKITWLDLPQTTGTYAGTLSAAQTAGASPFDSPAGIALGPDGTLYLACRGNPARTVPDALNPRANNDNGHIVAFTFDNNGLTSKTFTGHIALAAGNPATAQGTQYTQGSAAWLRKPTTLDIDSQGQLWVGTNQNGAVTATADGLFTLQTAGPSKYLLNTAYLAPTGAAIGAAAFDAATKSIFSVVRHPGATPSASFAAPATRWPTMKPTMPPQTTFIVLTNT
jgi:secreted PhoX family phosphatase